MKIKSPLKSARSKCIDCAGTSSEVQNCTFVDCPLHPLRNGKYLPRGMSRVKAIRKYCVEWCMCGQPKEVRLCPVSECSLHPFRFGKRAGATKTAAEHSPECEKGVADAGFFERSPLTNGILNHQISASKNAYRATIQHSSTT